jgi:hypothetical protein
MDYPDSGFTLSLPKMPGRYFQLCRESFHTHSNSLISIIQTFDVTQFELITRPLNKLQINLNHYVYYVHKIFYSCNTTLQYYKRHTEIFRNHTFPLRFVYNSSGSFFFLIYRIYYLRKYCDREENRFRNFDTLQIFSNLNMNKCFYNVVCLRWRLLGSERFDGFYSCPIFKSSSIPARHPVNMYILEPKIKLFMCHKNKISIYSEMTLTILIKFQ